MSKLDKQFNWLRKRVFVPANQLFNTLGAAGVDVDATDANITHIEIASTGIVAPEFANGESFNILWKIPYDLDPKFKFGVRVHWTGDVSADATCLWTFVWQLHPKTSAALGGTTIQLTTVPANDGYYNAAGVASTTDWIPQVSSRGWIDPLVDDSSSSRNWTMTQEDIYEGRQYFEALVGATIANITSCRMLGIEFDYVPTRCIGPGNETDAPLTYTGGEVVANYLKGNY